ncbi:DUF3379 family protein [Ferrimonas senticii]|uniref:DUF3379 family protein n=1 Tax=Ferrimonas senticii TaxID=394566 RepID=UPI000423F19E|nr:DUF3379 family protein [Ferrimonas senticii]
MDDLEFRRRLLADPHDDQIANSDSNNSPQRQQFVQEVRQLDASIDRALDIAVPEDLAERLLLRQNLAVHQQSRRRHRWQLAAAASVAFAVGLSFTVFNNQPQDLGLHALAHMDHEASFIANVDEQVTLASLNHKMQPLGGTLTALPGSVRYANYCDFDGVRSLHVVMDTEHGQITLFVIPSQDGNTLPKQFDNDRYHGMGLDTHNLHLALVAEGEAELQPVMQQLTDNMQFL